MKNILIIGATSAVASEIACRYAKQGAKLFLIARNSDNFEKLKAKLGTSVVGGYCYDFNDTSKSQEAITMAVKTLGSIDIALIAHGYLGDQIKSETDFDHAESIINSNFTSAVALLVPLTQALKQQEKAKVAVLLSVAGDRGRPRNFTYGAAKGALATYLQGLRSALYKTGIEIYSFKLGPVDSPMTVDHEKNFSFSTVDKVAGIVIDSLDKRRYTIYVPSFWWPVMLVVRWLPEFIFQKLGFLSDR